MTVWHRMLYSCTRMATVGVKGWTVRRKEGATRVCNKKCSQSENIDSYLPAERGSFLDMLCFSIRRNRRDIMSSLVIYYTYTTLSTVSFLEIIALTMSFIGNKHTDNVIVNGPFTLLLWAMLPVNVPFTPVHTVGWVDWLLHCMSLWSNCLHFTTVISRHTYHAYWAWSTSWT